MCRWVCGRLFEHGFLGLKPCNLVTIACPHLGVAEDDDVHGKNAAGRSWGAAVVKFLVSNAGGATGEELSQSAGDRRALLTWMADPASPFYQGLKAFERRALYACLRGDRTVSFYTAYFPTDDECQRGGNDDGGGNGYPGDGLVSVSDGLSSTCASCRVWAPTLGFVKPCVAGTGQHPHVFKWQRTLLGRAPRKARSSSGGSSNGDVGGGDGDGHDDHDDGNSAWEAASRYDALPLHVLAKLTVALLVASPVLVLWLGLVVPLFTLSRWAARRAWGPASPSAFPVGLAPPMCLDGDYGAAAETSAAPAAPAVYSASAESALPPRNPRTASKAAATHGVAPRSHANRATMAAQLNALGWEKHVALFSYAKDGLTAAHTHGPIVFRATHFAAGRDVVEHISKSLKPACGMCENEYKPGGKLASVM